MVELRGRSKLCARRPDGRTAGRLAAAVRDLRRTGVAGPLAILLTGLAGVLAGGTILGERAVTREVSAWRAALRLVVVLREAGPAGGDLENLVAAVRTVPGVATVRYVSAEAALADLRRHLGPTVDGLGRLPANPLPARLEITPVSTLDAAGLEGLETALRGLPAAEEVWAALGWVAPVERLLRGVRRVGWGLTGLVALAAVLAVAAGTAAARRDGTDAPDILPRLGDGAAPPRSPLLGQAMVQGGAGAALGIGLLVLLSGPGMPGLGGGLPAALGLDPLPAPPWSLQAGLLGGGCLVGLLGGLAGRRP
jgi:cell division protein FtsX